MSPNSNQAVAVNVKQSIRLPFRVRVEVEDEAGQKGIENVNVTSHQMPVRLAVKLVLMRNLPHIFHEDDPDWQATGKTQAEAIDDLLAEKKLTQQRNLTESQPADESSLIDQLERQAKAELAQIEAAGSKKGKGKSDLPVETT